jgi:hypothetical protein
MTWSCKNRQQFFGTSGAFTQIGESCHDSPGRLGRIHCSAQKFNSPNQLVLRCGQTHHASLPPPEIAETRSGPSLLYSAHKFTTSCLSSTNAFASFERHVQSRWQDCHHTFDVHTSRLKYPDRAYLVKLQLKEKHTGITQYSNQALPPVS